MAVQSISTWEAKVLQHPNGTGAPSVSGAEASPSRGPHSAAVTSAADSAPGAAQVALTNANAQTSEKVLPLPGWLTKVYFIFPVVLYIPDALFNYYVYSDGISNKASTNPVMQVGFVVLWSFLSVGVVGMAYLLSVLAPWHWGQGHRIQAIFCGFGVLVATGITTWNSLSYRSNQFIEFQTDKWAYVLWPLLQANHVSVTMILVSIAPPFWGLFWAIVQPTQTGRSLRQLQESHEERLMRLQQEAELKRLRAQTNATIREAQVRGMAQTATALREQAGGVLARRPNNPAAGAGEPATLVAAQIDGSLQLAAYDVAPHPDSLTVVLETAPETATGSKGRFEALNEDDGDTGALSGAEHDQNAFVASAQSESPALALDGAQSASSAKRNGPRVLKPGSKPFRDALKRTVLELQRSGTPRNFHIIAKHMGEDVSPDDVKTAFFAMRDDRRGKLVPGQQVKSDPVLDDNALLVSAGDE